jgi:hypothetical protein
MKNSKEQGHEKNAANLDQLIAECRMLGDLYQPSREDLSLGKLTDLRTRAKAILVAQGSAKSELDKITNIRAALFEQLPKLATRIFRAARASGFADKSLDDLKEHLNKIRGRRATSKTSRSKKSAKRVEIPEEGEAHTPPVAISVSQMSFDNLARHFREMIDDLRMNSLYHPNEEDLKVETLVNRLATMDDKSQQCKTAAVNLSALRQQRNDVLYKTGTGVCAISTAVKDYVMSVAGARGGVAKRVRKITFKKLVAKV